MSPHLSAAFPAGTFLFCSGQLAFDAQGGIAGDIGAQTQRCLQNLTSVLASHDLGLDDIVKTTVWLRHAEDFPAFNAAYAQVFGSHRPARSTVVSGLALPAALVEIEAIARRKTA